MVWRCATLDGCVSIAALSSFGLWDRVRRTMGLRKIFHNGREVRAGWRLILFCVLIVAIAFAARMGLEFLHLADYPGLHPVDLIIADSLLLLTALIATAIMARFEHRSLAVYG